MTHEEALKPLDSAIWEMGEAFDGLEDRDLFVRPHPNLLSVGELARHVATGEAMWLFPKLSNPILNSSDNYYPSLVVGSQKLEISAVDLYSEVKRVYEACKAHILEARPNLTDKLPQREDWTWGYAMEYMAFHIAYHTGQMYSVRHLMGHETANN